MNRKRGPEQPSSGSTFQHEIDYAGLPRDVEEEAAEQEAAAKAEGEPRVDELLSLKLTQALHNKLQNMARDEGVTMEQLVQELLAEGATLRAWEIIERKTAMRGSGQPQGNGRPFNGNGYGNNGQRQHGNHHNNGNRQGGNHGHSQGGRGGPNQNNRPARGNNAWMEDKAAFLEYVRNQEKRRR